MLAVSPYISTQYTSRIYKFPTIVYVKVNPQPCTVLSYNHCLLVQTRCDNTESPGQQAVVIYRNRAGCGLTNLTIGVWVIITAGFFCSRALPWVNYTLYHSWLVEQRVSHLEYNAYTLRYKTVNLLVSQVRYYNHSRMVLPRCFNTLAATNLLWL